MIIGLVLFSIFAIWYAVTRPYTIHHSFFERPMAESQNITATWNDYLETCSGEKIIENQVHALHEFSQRYENNVVDLSAAQTIGQLSSGGQAQPVPP